MRTNQDRPVCFKCKETIDHSPIFAAPCGHDQCRSAVWHGLCLMEFWEESERADDKFEVVGFLVRKAWSEESEEHTENGGTS